MTIQQCKYVLEIAKAGSFSEAAKQLFIAQSSLSISIKSLEQELNIRIFERSGNGVYLTDDGAEFSSFKVSERQLWWLENEALKTDKHVIIMTHTPFFVEFPGAGNRVPNGDRVMALVEQFIAAGGHFVAYLYGHTHKQSAVVDENGRRHMSFQNGGNNAEAVMIDTQSRTIETVGFGGSISRKVTY